MAVAQFTVRPTVEPPLAGGSTFCAVIATVYLSKAPNTYGSRQIDYELAPFNLVKRLNTIGNSKVRAEKDGNGGQIATGRCTRMQRKPRVRKPGDNFW